MSQLMLRDVAKSMVGFSCAVSLFSIQQISKLMTPSSGPGEATASEFDELSRVVQSHLTGPVAERFRVADQWQRRVVDAVFDAASVGTEKVAATMDPKAVVEAIDPRRVVQAGVDIVQWSVETIRQGGQAAPAVEAPPVR
jgi:hypothetical protein